MRRVNFFRNQEKSFNFFRVFLRENFRLSNAPVTERQFSEFCEAILSENKKFNLTSLKSAEEIYEILFLDSLIPFTFLPGFKSGERVIDVGSGAGIPGLVLALVFPDATFYLLDSTRKKCQFVEKLIKGFGMKNARVMVTRAEEAGRDPSLREKFDYALARSLAQLNILFEYALPFIKPGGHCYAYKGKLSPLEVTHGEGALMELGGTLEKQDSYLLPFSGKQRVIVRIKKTGLCPDKYPRRPGIPKKRPL